MHQRAHILTTQNKLARLIEKKKFTEFIRRRGDEAGLVGRELKDEEITTFDNGSESGKRRGDGSDSDGRDEIHDGDVE